MAYHLRRREFPKAVRAAAFARANGRCESCTAKLMPGRFHYDHELPDGLGGEPTLENCKVLCRACHVAKTAASDVPAIAKAKRQQAVHIGAKPRASRPLPGGRASPWKITLRHGTVRREGQ